MLNAKKKSRKYMPHQGKNSFRKVQVKGSQKERTPGKLRKRGEGTRGEKKKKNSGPCLRAEKDRQSGPVYETKPFRGKVHL